MAEPILLAQRGATTCHLLPSLANRHGLVTGATGTGKTITLQKMAESFSRIGVPVFMADVKGDLTGISQPGKPSPKLLSILAERGLEPPAPMACPTAVWDVFGEQGHPVRATISDMGPLLLSRMLELNDTQAGVLNLVFKIADDEGLALLDLKDLRAMLAHVGEHARDYTTEYGNVSAASIGAIQRGLLVVEQQGGDRFFGEPMLDIHDLMQTVQGQGVVNILAAEKLMAAPRLYGTFLLWMLSELFETLPEVGDLDKPKLVFVFDEAHLLFADCPPSLQQRIEQVVRLIRSKGVGVYFCTQSPSDIPDVVLAQLGHRIQHALRAFTPRDQKAVRVAAETFVPNPALDTARVIAELGVGEALVSTLQGGGQPSMVERTMMAPPGCRLGAITPEERAALRAQSGLAGKYDTPLDRDSASEMLERRAAQASPEPGRETGGTASTRGNSGNATEAKPSSRLNDFLWGTGRRQGAVEAMTKSAARTVGNQLGRTLLRGLLGGLLGGRR